MLTLSRLEQAYKQTFHTATPHREVNFQLIRDLTGEPDPEVIAALVFVEKDGMERYLCNVGRQKLAFQVDLLPGLIKTESRDDTELR